MNAYYPEEFLDLGCKKIEDTYDAIKKNATGADGKVGNINGRKVRLVPADLYKANLAERRQKIQDRMEKAGEAEPVVRGDIPFYPF